MKVTLRLRRDLLEHIHQDLSRPHPFAAERVGFLACRLAATSTGLCILGQTYLEVADGQYENDTSVGAMMNGEAIRLALEYAYNHDAAMFHVHRHEHVGRPRFSFVDESETAKFVPDFWKVAPALVHGALVLSRDGIHGKWWDPRTQSSHAINEYITVGFPMTLSMESPE